MSIKPYSRLNALNQSMMRGQGEYVLSSQSNPLAALISLADIVSDTVRKGSRKQSIVKEKMDS
jgi:hypothetical protein